MPILWILLCVLKRDLSIYFQIVTPGILSIQIRSLVCPLLLGVAVTLVSPLLSAQGRSASLEQMTVLFLFSSSVIDWQEASSPRAWYTTATPELPSAPPSSSPRWAKGRCEQENQHAHIHRVWSSGETPLHLTSCLAICRVPGALRLCTNATLWINCRHTGYLCWVAVCLYQYIQYWALLTDPDLCV